MNNYDLLDQADEDALHASRLLNIEEKLYRRIQKRLIAPDSCISTIPQAPPTPPPDANAADEAAAAKLNEVQRRKKERESWKTDTLLDFAAFESNVIRVQFLLDSNERERARYANEKEHILETAQAVRDNNVLLHENLREAQDALTLRKTYDVLAENITANPALKPRDEQQAQIEKLHAEIEDLEREGHEYEKTWAERREQFGRIVEEGKQMLRLIRDEKEEAERKEGMETIEEGDPGTPKGSHSRTGTPRPEESSAAPVSTQMKNHPVETREHLPLVPQSNRTSRAGTPMHRSEADVAKPEDSDAFMSETNDVGQTSHLERQDEQENREKMDTT